MYRLLALLLLSSSALADSPGGYDEPFKQRDLLALCTGSVAQVAECDRYVAGVRAGMTAQRLFMGFMYGQQKQEPDALTQKLLTNEPFCNMPKGTTPVEIRSVVVDLIHKDGGKNDNAAASFVTLMALSTKYGCGTKQP